MRSLVSIPNGLTKLGWMGGMRQKDSGRWLILQTKHDWPVNTQVTVCSWFQLLDRSALVTGVSSTRVSYVKNWCPKYSRDLSSKTNIQSSWGVLNLLQTDILSDLQKQNNEEGASFDGHWTQTIRCIFKKWIILRKSRNSRLRSTLLRVECSIDL